MGWQVLIPDRLSSSADIEAAIFPKGTTFFLPAVRHENSVPDAMWAEADAVLAWHEVNLNASIIERLRNCKVIVRVGAGYDNVDLRASGERGIVVCNVPDYGTEDVADHAMSLLLALARGLVAYDQAARVEAWRWDCAGGLRRIAGSVLGIVGFGRIGTAVALRAKAFGMQVCFYDPYKDRGYDKALGVRRYDRLDDLLTHSDAVSIHTPLTDETRGMVNDEFFSQLRADSIFVNTARGACVDIDSLYSALRSGRLRAAGLDVLPEEPPPPHHPLIKAWRDQEKWLTGRLVITPHAAFYNIESYREMRQKAAKEATRVLEGHPPLNCVNGQWLK